MSLEGISYDGSPCPESPQTGMNLSAFQNSSDDDLNTCDVISRTDITGFEVVWKFTTHKSGVNRFQVVLSGSQSCSDGNTVWFVPIEKPATLAECSVSQNTVGVLKQCLITCKCSCTACEYLHFRVQMPDWMKPTLAICHFELYRYAVELPFIIV